MSDTNLGTATAFIRVDASGVAGGVGQANSQLAQLSNVVNQNWHGLQTLGVAFAALPAAVAAGVGAAFNMARAWEDALFTIQRTSGETDEVVAQIGEEIMQVARTTPLATTELAALAAAGAQLGIANESLSTFAETMGLLISATDLTEAHVGDFARVVNVMRLPQEEMDNFATTILEVGRNTAATESEILNISKRMSGVAAAAGFSAAELVGLGAAVISLGPRAEAGATALNKTITDIIRAISEGGDSLRIFAEVAGQSSEQFAQNFGTDAAGTIAAFMTGLARLDGAGQSTIAVLDEMGDAGFGQLQADAGAVIGVLDELGIKESRQASALLQLAQGTLDVGNEQRDLNTILAASTGYYNDSNALQEIAAQKAATFSGQMQLLKNAIFEFGSTIGGFLIGPLGFLVQRLLDFLAGIQALPGPLKFVAGALFALLTAMSAVAAATFLIAPRLLNARLAYLQLTGGALGAGPALASSARSMDAAGRSALIMAGNVRLAGSQMNAMNLAGVNANLANFGRTGAVAAGSFSRFTPAVTGATTGIGRLGTAASRFARIGGWATAAMAALSIGAVILGGRQRQAAAAAETAIQPNADLVAIMRAQGAAIGPSATAWVQAQPAYLNAAAAARQLGFDLAVLNRIIMGQGTPQDMGALTATLRTGGERAREMGADIVQLGRQFQASQGQAQVATGGTNDALAEQEEALGGASAAQEDNRKAQERGHQAATKHNEALREQVQVLEAIAQAHTDLADAVVSQRNAAFALADAQEAYNDALRVGDTRLRDMQRAELTLARSRFDAAGAQRELRERELALSEARQEGLDNLRDAQQSLDDAHERYRDSLEKISDQEREIAELRAGPSAQVLVDATNDLRDAELRLSRAHQTVGDAEWYLQHLREEGASQRDIEDAEFALAEARQDVSEADSNVIKSQGKLNDLRSGAGNAEKLADAEEALSDAYRDSQRALREIGDAQETVEDARQRIADDTDYRDAQDDITEAHFRVRQALQATRDAEISLEEVRNRRASDDAARAANDLEAAIISMAQANVEVRRQQALANGETWDAGDAAHALAEELSQLVHLAPNAAAATRLRNYIATLRRAPNVPDEPPDVPDLPDAPDAGDNPYDVPGGGGLGGIGGLGELPPMPDVGGYFDELEGLINEEVDSTGPSIWDRIWGVLGGGAGIGAGVGGFVGMAFGPVGSIVGAIIGGIIGGLVEKFWPEISGFFSRLWEMVARNFPQWFENVKKFFTELPGKVLEWLKDLPENVANFFRALPGRIGGFLGQLLGVLIKTFVGIPVLIFRLLKEGLPIVIKFFKDLPRNIFDNLVGIGEWLREDGVELIRGLARGFADGAEAVGQWFVDLPGNIAALLDTGWDFLWEKAREVVAGFIQGLEEQLPGATQWLRDLPGKLLDAVGNAGTWLSETGKDIIRGLWAGIVSMWENSPLYAIGQWLYDNVVTPVKNFLGIQSPSTVFFGIGGDIIQGLINGIWAFAQGVWDFFIGLPGRLWGYFTDAFNWLTTDGADLIGGFLQGIWDGFIAVGQWFLDLPGNISDFFSDVWEWIKTDGVDLLRGFFEGIGDGAEAVWNWFTDLPDRIGRYISNIYNWLQEDGRQLLRGLLQGIVNGAQIVWNWLIDLPGRIGGYVVGAIDWLWQAGRNLVIGFAEGIWSAINDNIVYNAVESLGQGAIDATNWILGNDSPSKVFKGIGQYVGQGFALGILAEKDAVVKAAEAIAEAAIPDLSDYEAALDSMATYGVDKAYVNGMLSDVDAARNNFAMSVPGMQSANSGNVTYHETLNLEAITTADPTEIVNEYVWARRVRMRGA